MISASLPIRSPILQARRARHLLPRPSVALLHRTMPVSSSGGGAMIKAQAGLALGGPTSSPCHPHASAVRAHAAAGAAPATPGARPRVALVVTDFDETCTTADTTGLLMAAASRARAEGGTPGTEGLPRALADNYAVRYAQLMAVLMPDGGAARPLQQQAQAHGASPPLPPFDPSGLSAFLRRLSEFDAEMNAHAADAGARGGSRPLLLRCPCTHIRTSTYPSAPPTQRHTHTHTRAHTHTVLTRWFGGTVGGRLPPQTRVRAYPSTAV
jgi:hypothetical protein